MEKIILLIPLLLLSGCRFGGKNTDPNKFYDKHNLSLKDGQFDSFLVSYHNDNHPKGEKILLSLVQTSCAACHEQSPYIEKYIKKHKDISFYDVYLDEYDDYGDNYFIENYQKYSSFLGEAQSVYFDSYYYQKAQFDCDMSIDGLLTPTNIFIDFSNNSPSYTSIHGISELCFRFDSMNMIDDMVNHSGLFGNN